MAGLQEIRVAVEPLDRFAEVIGRERLRGALGIAARARRLLSRRVVWNVNSTGVGGGVAEMLQSLLGYARSVGIDTRWMVIAGDEPFFRVTKRLHNALHGADGDGSELDDEARRIYEDTLHRNAVELASLVRPGDIALLHDPQTAGLAKHLRAAGVHVLWRCHVGSDGTDENVELGWRFLEPYLKEVPLFVFSRKAYVPPTCDQGRSLVIQPSIDAFSAKNQELSPDAVRTILVHTGLVEGPPPAKPDHGFVRDDGSPGRVERRADVVRLGRAPAWDAPLVTQISRWDALKDMRGVMEGFALLINGSCPADAELVLAGPNVKGVADDPEGAQVFQDVVAAWRELPHAVRDHVHIATLPTGDVQENAVIVNALQRHSAIVVQKSLREGFGLTVTEAMWKARAVVATATGGIQDQIEDGVSGVLLKDPSDLPTFAHTLCELLQDEPLRERLGTAARERVRDHFLGLDHLLKYADVIAKLLSIEEPTAPA